MGLLLITILFSNSKQEDKMEIGNRIRNLRRINNLTLEELASRCELTKGFLSQLERDLSTPSINTLRDICEVLGISLSDFFQETTQEKVVFTQEDFFVDKREDCTIAWIVPNAQMHNMEPILVTLPPAGKSPVLQPHEGEEFGFVISGSITLLNEERKQKIEKGQSFYLNGDSEHRFINESGVQAKFIWVTNPPLF